MDASLRRDFLSAVFAIKRSAVGLGERGELTPGEIFVVRKLGSDGAVVVGAVREALGTSLSAVSQTISSLERKGYVTRAPSSEDRRRIIVGLTEKGERFHSVNQCHLEREIDAALERFGEEKARAFITLIKEFAGVINDSGKTGE